MNTKTVYNLFKVLSLLLSRGGVIGWALFLPESDNTIAYSFLSATGVAFLCILLMSVMCLAVYGGEALQLMLPGKTALDWIYAVLGKVFLALTPAVCIGSLVYNIQHLSNGEIIALSIATIISSAYGGSALGKLFKYGARKIVACAKTL